MASLQIYFLGNFQILINHSKISSDLWQSRQLRTILKILIIQRGKPVPASQIIEKIWPEKDPELAPQHLYVRISQIRKILKKSGLQDCIQTVPGGYIFQCDPTLEENGDHSFWIDVDEFENEADQGREKLEKKAFNQAINHFKKSINLYRADFLIEDLYEDWTISERERLRDRHLMVLTEMAEAYAQTGRYRHAIDVCQRVLSVDPCRESTFVQLMFYYYHLGERSKSLEVFEKCKKVLSQEMDVSPDAYTIELAQKIRLGDLGVNNGNGKYPPSVYSGRLFEVPYSLSETPFLGREIEFSWLFQQVQNPYPSIIWVNGESGVGKTRLLEEFFLHSGVEKTKFIKLFARTIENTPYAIWIACLENYSYYLDTTGYNNENRKIIRDFLNRDKKESKLFSVPATQITKQKIQNAIVDILQRKLPYRSIIWIDDIHLVDEASLSLLEILGENYFIIISSTTEDEHDSPHYNEFLKNQSKSITTFTLKRWQFSQVESFIDNLSGKALPTLSESLFSISAGNPLIIINTLQHLFEEGILYVNSEGDWQQTQPVDLKGSQKIENLVSIRLKKNTVDEQRILDVVSVAGGECDYSILEDVLHIQETKLLDLTDRLIQRGFLIEPRIIGESELTFSHNIYREVIYRSLPKPRLRRFHKRIGDALVQSGRNSEQYAEILANHFSSGGDYEKAAHYSLAAGEYLLSMYAPQQAISYYEKAIQWFVEHKNLEALGKSYFGLAETLRLTGKSTLAIENYQMALPLLEGEVKQVAIYQIFQLKVLQGDPLSSYQEIADAAETSISKEGISWALPLLFWSHSFVFLLMGNYNKTRFYHAKGWQIARELCASGNTPPTWIYNRALTLMMRAHNQWGNYHTSIHFSQKNLALLPSNTQDVNIKAVVDASLGESYYNLGEYQKARYAYQNCNKLSSKAGDQRLMGESLIGLASISFEIGDFESCLSNTQKVLDLVQKKLDVLRYIQAIFLQTKLAIVKEKKDTEVQKVETILSMARYQQSNVYVVKSLLLIAEINLVQEKIEQAELFAKEAREISELSRLKREVCQSNRLCGLVAQQKGDYKAAYAFMDKAIELAEQISAPFELGLTLRSRSKIEPLQHEEDLQEALSIFDKIGAAFELQRTKELLVSLRKTKFDAKHG